MMTMSVLFLAVLAVAALVGAFAYRIRGGGFFKLNGDTEARAVWSMFGLVLPFAALTWAQGAAFDVFHIGYTLWLFAVAFLAMMIPHAFAQNMGTFIRPWNLGENDAPLPVSKFWPGAWLPYIKTQADWDTASGFRKTALDFLGMMSVCLVRSVIAFGLAAVPAIFLFGMEWYDFAGAAIVLTVGSPVGYLIGRFLPSVGGSLLQGACWGEFLTGAVWVLALGCL